jgi:hypothetical protein
VQTLSQRNRRCERFVNDFRRNCGRSCELCILTTAVLAHARSQPFGNQPVVFDPAGFGGGQAEVVVEAVDRDDGLAGVLTSKNAKAVTYRFALSENAALPNVGK